jgi:Ca2+-binding EF-hand superfamily protein
MLDKDIKLIFDRYDKNKDGIVSYADFKEEITPTKSHNKISH